MPSILHDESYDAMQAPHAYNEPQHSIRVLHIDDQPDQLQLVKLFLEREDPAFQVDFVSSGEKALERLKEQQYDCIVSDYMMPGMDGINLAYRIREISDVPFVLYTGHGSEEVASAAFAAGVDDYMRKEIDPSHYEVLARRIRTAVEKRRVENALIESERKYRSLVHDSRDGIMVFAGEELVFANQQAATLHGCDSVEELMKVGPGTLLHPEDKEYVEGRSLARQRGDDIPPVTEYRVIRPDGVVRYVESSSSLIQYDGKNSTLAFIRDITSRKRYEKRLEALYSYATDLSRPASIKDVAEMTFDAIEQVLGFDLVHFSIVDVNLLRDVSVRGTEPVEGYALPLDGPGITVRAVNTGETQLVSDTRLDEDFTGGLSQDVFGSLSELAVPVKIGGEVVAVINVESIKLDAFTEEDRRLLEIFAEYVASTIRGLREQAERQRYEERLEALHAHATDLGRVENLDDVFKLTLDTMEETLGLQIADILVVEGNRLRQVERGGSFPLDRELLLDGRGVTVRAVNTQRSQRVPDVRKGVDYVGLHRPDTEKTLSELAVPVCIGDEAVAVLNVESTMLDAYNEEDQRLLETLAEHVASAISRLKHVEMLKASEEKWRNLLEESMDAVLIIVGTEFRYVNRRLADLLGYSGPSELIGSDLLEFVTSEYREMIRIRTLRRQKGEEEPKRYEYKLLRRDGTQIDAETQTSLIKYEGQPAALSFIRDITERKQYEERLQALHRHATELVLAKNIHEMAESTFSSLEQTLGFDQGSFSVVDGGVLRFVLLKGVEGKPKINELPLDGPGITIRAIRKGETQRIADVRQDEDFVLGTANGYYQPLSELAVPVKIEGEVVALINLESKQLDAFSENDQRLLETLALHVASAIQGLEEQAEQHRYEERLEALHRHATELSEAGSLMEIGEMTFNVINRVLGFTHGGFAVVEGDMLQFIYNFTEEIMKTVQLPLDGPGITVRTIRTGETQLVPDIREDEDFVPGFAEGVYDCLSELVVPVKVSGEAVAVLNVESIKLDAFTEEDRRLLEIFAEHVASAMSRLRREEVLRASEEKWRNLLEESMDAVSVVVGLKIAYVNQSYVQLLGLGDPSDAIGRNALDFTAVEDRERIRRMALGRQRGEDHPTRYEFKMLKADGTQIDVENYVTDTEYKGEKASLSFVRDITERKKAEQKLLEYSEHLEEMVDERTRKLRDREEQLKILFEYAPDAIYINDLKGNFIDGNKAAEKMTGYNRDKLIGKSFLKINLLPLKQIPKAAMLLAKNALGQPTGPDEFTLNRKDGGQVTVEIRTYPIKIKGQISVLGIARDITERKRLEEELMFAERITVAGRVAAMVGHDLRGPLQTIKNAVYMLKRSPDSTNKMLEMIDRSVHRANQMLEEFRSQTCDTPLDLVSTDLAALINASVEEAQVPNSVNVVVNIGDGLEDVFVDPQKMRRVLDNLLENAVDAKPKGGVITVSAERTDDKVIIKVSDTGVGIPDEEMLKLFKPFYTTKHKGLGLGLAYCKRAVEAHSGTITVESEVGKGTTFTIHIPRNASESH